MVWAEGECKAERNSAAGLSTEEDETPRFLTSFKQSKRRGLKSRRSASSIQCNRPGCNLLIPLADGVHDNSSSVWNNGEYEGIV
jgi:hypothetical protein